MPKPIQDLRAGFRDQLDHRDVYIITVYVDQGRRAVCVKKDGKSDLVMTLEDWERFLVLARALTKAEEVVVEDDE